MIASKTVMDETTQTASSGWDAKGWVRSIALGVGLFVVYAANGREIGQYDTEPTTLTALSLARGDGIFLDRFRPVLRQPDGTLLPFVAEARGHIVSRYPLATALLAVPLVLPQTWYFDARYPGWDQRPDVAWSVAKLMGKHAAAVFAALAAVAIYRLLRRMGLGRVALPATLAAALGTDLWTVGSQALWQHAPAALLLTGTMLLLLPERPSRLRLGLAGLATALLVACRAIDVVFALVVLGWVAATHPGRLSWFLIAPLAVAVMLLSYNLSLFETLSGGQAALEAMHPEVHGVAGPWTGNPVEGLVGTLFSPSRGLFVYLPLGAAQRVPLALDVSILANRLDRPLAGGRRVGRIPPVAVVVCRLVGGAYLRAAVLDRRHPAVRRAARAGLELVPGTCPGAQCPVCPDDPHRRRHPVDRRVLLPQFVEPLADEHRPRPRPPLGLGRYGVAALPG